MLRASAKQNQLPVNLVAMTDRSQDLALPNGEVLLAFAQHEPRLLWYTLRAIQSKLIVLRTYC